MQDGVNRNPESTKRQFVSPQSRYYGDFTPEHLAFNANLQEFAQRVALLCSLETGGKLSPVEAYEQIRELWGQLKDSKKNLLDHPEPPIPELPPDESL